MIGFRSALSHTLNTNRPPGRSRPIVATDVVGYSRLMGEDEAGTLACLGVVGTSSSGPLPSIANVGHSFLVVRAIREADGLETVRFVEAPRACIGLKTPE